MRLESSHDQTIADMQTPLEEILPRLFSFTPPLRCDRLRKRVAADPLIERPRKVHGVLAGKRVSDEQHLMRARGTLDLGGLRHHCLIERSAPSCIEQDHIETAEPARL